MSCDDFKNELMLSFGKEDLPKELKQHLMSCESCRSFNEDLEGLTGFAGTDDNFSLAPEAIERMVERVNDKLNLLDKSNITEIKSIWKTYLPVAAAVVLLLGISSITYWMSVGVSNTNLAEEYNSDTLVAQLDASQNVELDDNAINYLIYEYGYKSSDYATELLLDDITDEELEYLENNFNVGEIL